MQIWRLLGDARRLLGDHGTAHHASPASLTLGWVLENPFFIFHSLIGFSAVPLTQGDPQRATHLLAAVQQRLNGMIPFLLFSKPECA